MVGVSSRTSCRQLFQELNILTLVSLYIMEVICYIRKHHQFVDLNSNLHTHNTRRKMDIHNQSYNTDLYKRSVINMGTKLYNKLSGHRKEIGSYKTFKKELKSLLLLHSFYSVEEFVALYLCNFISSVSNLSFITLYISASEIICRILCSLLLDLPHFLYIARN
jgi:hypothetical protein